MLYKVTKLGSSTNLLNSVAGFAYCSVFVFQANVMPHPPLRSRPTSAGATRTRPSSAGRERITGPPVARGNYHHHYHHYYHPAFSVGMLWIRVLFHAFQSDIVLARSSLLILEFFKIRSVNEHGHLIFSVEEGIEWSPPKTIQYYMMVQNTGESSK